MNRTGIQNAVVITDRLASEDLEQEAARLFSQLRVGELQKGRGVLYLFSPARKLLKIEVGYALEGVLPDIAVNGLELAAKTFIYTDRYQDFWAELINTINIEVFERERGVVNQDYDFSQFRFMSGGAGISSREYDVSMDQLMREFRSVASDDQYEPMPDVSETVNTYLKSLHDGVGDSKLRILSLESRIFREFTPLTTFQLFRNWRMYTRAGIDKVFQEGNLAFVFFKPKQPVLPIVLRKDDGVWRVDEPLSWSLFHRFEDSMQVFIKYPLAGISKECASYMSTNLSDPLYPLNKPIHLSTLQAKELNDADLESVYLRLFWLSRAAKLLKAQNISKQVDLLWMAADIYLNLGRMSEFADAYSQAASVQPNNQKLQTNAQFYRELIQFKDEDWLLKRNSNLIRK